MNYMILLSWTTWYYISPHALPHAIPHSHTHTQSRTRICIRNPALAHTSAPTSTYTSAPTSDIDQFWQKFVLIQIRRTPYFLCLIVFGTYKVQLIFTHTTTAVTTATATTTANTTTVCMYSVYPHNPCIPYISEYTISPYMYTHTHI